MLRSGRAEHPFLSKPSRSPRRQSVRQRRGWRVVTQLDTQTQIRGCPLHSGQPLTWSG